MIEYNYNGEIHQCGSTNIPLESIKKCVDNDLIYIPYGKKGLSLIGISDKEVINKSFCVRMDGKDYNIINPSELIQSNISVWQENLGWGDINRHCNLNKKLPVPVTIRVRYTNNNSDRNDEEINFYYAAYETGTKTSKWTNGWWGVQPTGETISSVTGENIFLSGNTIKLKDF